MKPLPTEFRFDKFNFYCSVGCATKARHVSSLKPCAQCLYKVGFGIKRIAKSFGRNPALIFKWVKCLAEYNPKERRAVGNLRRRGKGRRCEGVTVFNRNLNSIINYSRSYFYVDSRVLRRIYQREYFKRPIIKTIRAIRHRTWKVIKFLT